MVIDYSDEVGWPAQGTSVTADATRLFPAPRYQAEREKELTRHKAWRNGADAGLAWVERTKANRHRWTR